MNPDLNHDLQDLLPPCYSDILDYQELCHVEENSFSLLEKDVRQTLNNFFVQTADEPTISLWEKVFHIVSNPGLESLDYRRQRVLNRIAMQPPFTLTFLYRKLDHIIGPGKWDCTVNYPAYTLSVRSRAENQLYYSELAALIQIIKPAHIAFVNVPMFTTGILISETIQQQSYANNYRLGSWALGTLPFRSIQDTTIVKPGQTPSLKPAFFEKIAVGIQHLIKKFSAGDDIHVDDVSSTISPASIQNGASRYLLAGRELLIGAHLPYSAGEGYNVTVCKLLDDEGVVLFSSPCFFPVKTQTEVQTRCTVLEDASFAQTQDGALIPVMPDELGTAALQADFLSEAASCAVDLIGTALLNSDTTLEVRKYQGKDTVTVEYDISQSDSIGPVHDLALVDPDGDILTQTRSTLSDAVLITVRHTLQFKEGTLSYGR